MVMWFAQRPPSIDAVTPSTAETGATITVEGSGFGQQGRLTIDRRGLPEAAVRRWTSNLIILTIPERQASGLVRVTTRNGESNPVFLTVADQLPRTRGGAGVQVDAVSPDALAVGGRLIIEGRGFGPRTGGSRVRIAANGGFHEWRGASSLVPVWTEQRIELVLDRPVPPGSYELEINGSAVEQALRIAEPQASVAYGPAESYGLTLTTRAENAAEEMVLVVPRLPDLPEQPASQLVESNREPVDRDSRSVRYRLATVEAGGDDEEAPPPVQLVERTVVVERRSLRWSLDAALGSAVLLEPWFRLAFRPWLAPPGPTAEPQADELISELAAGIDVTAPVITIVRSLDERVRTRLDPDPAGVSRPWELTGTDPETGARAAAYAELAVALARRLGVPARRHMGVILDDAGEAVDHVWVEYFVPGPGWYPSDPALADGLHASRTSGLDAFYGEQRVTLGALDARRASIAIDGREPVRRYPLGAVLLPEESWAPGHLWMESPAATLPDDLRVRWERPRLFPWFN